MMLRMFLGLMGIVIAGSGSLQSSMPQSASPAAEPFLAYRTVVNQYCVTCHNERLKTAGLLLDKMDLKKIPAGAEVWEKVIRKLRAGSMPPPGTPRPDRSTYDSLITYLETEIDRAAAARPNPGRPATVHRLNQAEYKNAIRDLLTVVIDVGSLLPADESNYGFDNIGDTLSVSPLRMEKYLSAAKKISRLAIGDSAIRPVIETYEVSKYLSQDARMSEDLPFGSRGGIAIRHYFPADGQYVIKIRLQRDNRDRIRGLGNLYELDVRLDGARIKLFTIGGERRGKSAPVFSTAGQGDPAQEEYELTADEALEVRFPAKAGMRVVGVTFLRETWAREGALQYVDSKPESLPRLPELDQASYKGGRPEVDTVAIGGPYDLIGVGDTASRRKIFLCYPDTTDEEEPCAHKILATLARQAYRRPVTDQDIEPLFSLFKTGQNSGGFEAGIGMAVERILAGPEFLFRIERDPANLPPDTPYQVSDLELASRLSFFLWSSIPDDELLDLAERGKLREPEILEKQVQRMLADERSKAVVSNFADQWLYLRNLHAVRPDPEAFPEFDDNLRQAFQRETELLFESIIQEDRSVLDLLDANYTFVNERLARHYGIPNVYGSHFRRVVLNDPNRRGLLGQGSIMTVTSYGNRTSPVLRGKWVLENILGTPPPPPPPNVPSLQEGKAVIGLSMRQRMEEHRKNPVCASCHSLMDPLGFALENFDAIGQWRTTEGITAIDPSGLLPDGTQFEGPAGLREVLLTKREGFVSTFIEKLLTYALGRGVEYYDAPTIRRIKRETAPSGYRWSSVVQTIVKSPPFQMRRSREL